MNILYFRKISDEYRKYRGSLLLDAIFYTAGLNTCALTKFTSHKLIYTRIQMFNLKHEGKKTVSIEQ